MNQKRFQHLLQLVGSKLQKQNTFFRQAISPQERLALTLRYLAHGDSQAMLAINYRMGKSTVCGIIRETCNVLWDTLSPVYVKPPGCAEMNRIEADFRNLWNFSHCVGAIDGKHVMMQAPTKSGSYFFNYKHFHSLILLAVCDARHIFTFVDVGASGRQSGGGVFRNSVFGQNLTSGTLELPTPKPLPVTDKTVPHVFLGDEAFPLLQNLMRPFPGKNMTPQRAIFNYRLSRARRIIENAFGILVSKWRIYRRPIIGQVETVEGVIKATVALHNYLKISDLSERNLSQLYSPPGYADYVNSDGSVVRGQWRADAAEDAALSDLRQASSNMHSQAAQEIRNRFASYFCSSEGEVPWQYKVVNRGKSPGGLH